VYYDELLELVKGRRTIRALRPDPVPDGAIEKALEVAQWAPTGFNMQPAEFLVLKDSGLRTAVKKIVDEWIESDFYVLEATREAWQGPAWTLESRGRVACPLAPVYVLVLGDTRRFAGLPMNARYCRQKGESIFESSLANALMYLWLALHSLGLGAQPVSAVKNERVQGLLKHFLDLPDFMYVYELLAVGYSAIEGDPPAKLMRHLDEVVHRDRPRDEEFLSDEEVRKQIRKLRMGNVARHGRVGPTET
jgi:5,6-dimethylbenzimidazole synthase